MLFPREDPREDVRIGVGVGVVEFQLNERRRFRAEGYIPPLNRATFDVDLFARILVMTIALLRSKVMSEV